MLQSCCRKDISAIYLKKTKLVLTGKSKAQILAAITSAFEDKELPALAPRAMLYMMSKRQYLSDADMGWYLISCFSLREAPRKAGERISLVLK